MTLDSFELMADVLPEAMLLVTAEGELVAMNKAMRQMLGVAFEAAETRSVFEIFTTPPDQIKEYLRLCSGVTNFIPGTLKLRFDSSCELDLRCEGAALATPNPLENRIILRFKAKLEAANRFRWLNEQIIDLNREIGERIQLEEQRNHAEQNLLESLAREKAERESSERANRAKDDFLASLSHELRTPLNPVLLIASDASENLAFPQEVRGSFEIIRKAVELEARLIDDLLDLTRITHNKLVLHQRRHGAEELLRQAISHVQSDFCDKHIELVLKWSAPEAQVFVDDVRMHQVFWNILRNAVKFGPKGSQVTIETAESQGIFIVRVTDAGIGLTPAELERIFAPFTQGDHVGEQSHRFGGLGLGLTIARRLVELHAGRIWALSPGRDKGATFVVELPLVNMKRISQPSKGGSAPNAIDQTSPQISACILLVEDHEATRVALAGLLTRRNYKILSAGTMAKAREISKREKIDYVISDIGLPDGSGNDLMRELREKYSLKGIALTGYGMEQDVEDSRNAGFVTHLTKPVNVRLLESALTSLRSS